jgi:hypothetical protein
LAAASKRALEEAARAQIGAFTGNKKRACEKVTRAFLSSAG